MTKASKVILIGTLDEIRKHSMIHEKIYKGKDGEKDRAYNKFLYKIIDNCLYKRGETIMQNGKEKKVEHVFEVPVNNVNRAERRRRESMSGHKGRMYGITKSNRVDRTRKKEW